MGCGSERTFSADSFVEAMNSNGARLVLGDRLETERPEVELWQVELEEDHGLEGDEAGPAAGHTHGGGTLTIASGPEAGLAEYERCEPVESLVCFRAANAVLFFEDVLEPEERLRIGSALQAIAE